MQRVAATGTITCPAGSAVNPGDQFTLNDGIKTQKVFEISKGTVAATGTIHVVAGSLLRTGGQDTFVLNCGQTPAMTFEYRTVAGADVGNLRTIVFTAGDTQATIRTLTINKINSVLDQDLRITAVAGAGAGDIDLTNDGKGAFGNVTITETVQNAGFTVSGMSGGVGPAAVGAGNVAINIFGWELDYEVLTSVLTAINAIGADLLITATQQSTAVILLTNDVKGTQGNVLINSSPGGQALAFTGMLGGLGIPGERIHTTEIIDEILRLLDVNLRTSLSLKGVFRGMMPFMPAEVATQKVNGIWVNVEPSIHITPIQLPKDTQITYMIRLLLIRRININENVLLQKETDIREVIDMVYDNYTMSELTLSNGQILWWLPTEIEMEPPEDGYVATLAEDLVAIAFKTEIQVRTRR
jgi:hypothetical protein